MTPPTSSQMFDAITRPIAFAPPDGFYPCNPSIHYDGWTWRASVRTLNYRLGGPAPNGSTSINYLATLDSHLGVDDVRPITLPKDVQVANFKENAKVTGFEDLRLFSSGDNLCALATACDLDGGATRPGGWGVPELVYLQINQRAEITLAIPIRGPWSKHPQKNWMPVADGIGRAAIYRTLPTMILDLLDPSSYQFDDPLDWISSSLRGSSQLVWFDGGWLAVCHESTRKPLSYRHRFVWFDAGFHLRRVTDEFVWMAPGVEFCAGLATDGRRLVASFGVHDCEAHLAIVPPRAVLAKLRPIEFI